MITDPACHIGTIALVDVRAMIDDGLELARQGRIADAEAAFRRAVHADPGDWSARQNLGVALQVQEKHADAVAELEAAAALQPTAAVTRHSLAQCLLHLNRPADAIAQCRSALSHHPEHAELHAQLAEALLMSGDFRAGWAEYEWRWKCGTFKDARRKFASPQWRGAGEKLAGKTILIAYEQGFGDAIWMARYASLLAERGAEVIVEAPKELLELMRGVNGVSEVTLWGEPSPATDFHVPLMSLPLAFGTRASTVPAPAPYIRVPARVMLRWGSQLGDRDGKRVGLAWAARSGDERGARKSLPPELLQRLGDVEGVTFYSLQKGAPPPASLPMVNLTSKLTSFADTAALIANLDLVITVDTAVAHLAAAIAEPTWVMLPFAADFRWMLERRDSPWYPTMRLFRQPVADDWPSVIDEIVAELARF